MRKLLPVPPAILLAAALAAALAGPRPPRVRKPPIGGSRPNRPPRKPTPRDILRRGRFPTFASSSNYKLAVAELEARSKLDLSTPGQRDHSFSLEGFVAAPAEDDAVGILHKLKVLRAVDAEEHSVLKIKPPSSHGGMGSGGRKSPSRYEANLYAFCHDGVAPIEVPRTALRRSAYTLNELLLGAAAVLAEEREEKETRAIVMEEPLTLVPGVRIRVTSLQMTRSRELNVTCKCERPRAGGGPFVERVTVLDEDRKVLATGRWNQGDAWAKSPTLSAKLDFPGQKVHKYLRFTIVTKYQVKRMTFQVTGIFQK